VIGHELSHIRNYDTRLMCVVAVLVGMITLLADWLFRFRARGRNNNEGGGLIFLVAIVLLFLSPLIARLIQLAISRRREFLSDAGSIMLTRQPEGLISALKKLETDQEVLETANKATAHLYIVNPLKRLTGQRSTFAKLFNTHPPIEERIKALEEMK